MQDIRRLKNSWFRWLVFIIIGLVFFGFWKASEGIELQRKQLRGVNGRIVYISCDLAYGHKVAELTAQVSEDLSKYVGWSFFLPDRGICMITKTFNNPFHKNCVLVRGSQRARKAEILLLNPEAVRWIEWGE